MSSNDNDDAIEEAVLLLMEADELVKGARLIVDNTFTLLGGMDTEMSEQEMLQMGFHRTSSGYWYKHHPDYDNVIELY
mgnify:CR=1 FL=1